MRLGLPAALVVVAMGSWPTAAAAQGISATEGQDFSGPVATYQTSCPSPSSPAATISWGDGGSSAGQVTASGSQLVVSGSHTYLEEGSYAGSVSGTYLCNGDHSSFTAGFTADVIDAPLGVHGGLKLGAAADHSFSGRVATFTDSGGDAASYTATIDWGDHSSSSGTITPCNTGTFCVGTFFVSGSHQYSTAAATYTVTVTVKDDGGASASDTDTMLVANQLQCPANQTWGGPYSQQTLSSEYQLTSPYPVLDSGGNPTGQYAQTLWTGGIAAVTPGCWYAVGDAEPGPSHPTIHFLTYSSVSINGVYLIPESADSLLLLGTDGTLLAENWCGLATIKGVRRPAARGRDPGCSTSTYYDVEVPENAVPPYYIQGTGPLITLGRVDLRAHPIAAFGTSLGSFEPAPGGPQIGGNGVESGVIATNPSYSPFPYMAEIDAFLDLPGEFTTAPSSGGAVSSELKYYTQGPAPSGGSGSGGGGGGSSGENPCLQRTPPDCPPIHVQTTRKPAHAGAGARRGRESSWDPAAPVRAQRQRAHQADGSPCAPLTLGTPQLFLGGLHILNASLTCDPSARYPWAGTGELDFSELPGGQGLPDANLAFHLDAAGNFHDGRAGLNFGYPGVPVFATPPVNLQSLDIGIATHPTTFSGQAGLNVAGGLVKIDGGVLVVNADQQDRYTYPTTSCDQGLACPPLPGVPSLQTDTSGANAIKTFAAGIGGTVTLDVLGGVQLGNAYVFYVYPAYFEFGGCLGPPSSSQNYGYYCQGLSFLGGWLSVYAGLKGAADLKLGQYDVSGGAAACANFPDPIGSICPNVEAELSNVGVGGCGGIHALGTDWDLYAWLKWNGDHSIGLGGCDNIWPIHVNVQRSMAVRAGAAQSSARASFYLPPGLSSASITATGSDGAPVVAVAGPRGEGLSDSTPGSAAGSSQILIAPIAKLHQTLIGIKHPAAGRWTITPLSGSPAITAIDYTHSLPPLHVHLKVIDPVGTFSLRYQLPVERAQTITFIERSRGSVFHVLGRVQGGRGTLRFTPALGPAGRRDIVAVVAENGLPVRRLLVGRYVAPAIPRAGRVRHLRIARGRRALIVSWGAASNAHGYLVSGALTDGRRLSYTLRRHRLSIRTLQPGIGATVRVYALGPTGVLGPGASARLAPPPPPTRVTQIRVRRTRRGLVIGWRPDARATRYLLRITVNGPRRAVLFAFTYKATLTPKDAGLMLAPGSSSLIAIRGLSAEGQQGPAGTLRYNAPRRRRQKRPTHSPAVLDFIG